MILDKNGLVYSKLEFADEAEIEDVVVRNFTLLFGDYAVLLPKSKITTSSGKGTIPDGIVISFDEKIWYILEVERGTHGTWEHIAPQISKQITAMENTSTKAMIADKCVDVINGNQPFLDLLQEIGILEFYLHKTINEILKQHPDRGLVYFLREVVV
jgi:hypothetical protein